MTVLICDPDPRFRSRVATALGGAEEHESLEGVDAITPDVVVCGPGIATRDALTLAAGHPEIGIVLVAAKVGATLLRAALRAGVRDVLDPSFVVRDLRAAVERAGAQRLRGPGGPAPAGGGVITVFGAKGGSGKSFVASNLAVELARQTSEDVALVDLDLESGDLGIMLQLLTQRSVFDAAQQIEHLDIGALRGYLVSRGHVHLLPAPPVPGLGEKVSPEAVRTIVGLLREEFRYVVVDGPGTFTDQLLTCLDESTACVLVASMDVPGVKNLKLSLQTLDALGFASEKIRVVLNRVTDGVGLRPGEVEKATGRRIDVRIPSSREVTLSVNRGVPIAESSPASAVAQALAELARVYSGAARAEDSGRRTPRRLLERLVR